MLKLLQRWGFTTQKPAFKSYEQSPSEVRKWLKEKYPYIKRKAKRQHGLIFWLDEVGMRSQHQAGTTFAPKGKTPVIKKTGKRFYLNMISAITNTGRLLFMIIEGKFNGAVFLRFLQNLIKSTEKKVFLIADAHPAHRETNVNQWIVKHKKKIELFFLPGYSPELNQVEFFNQDLKTNVVGKARPKNKEQLKIMVEVFTKRKKRNPEKVKKYFHAESVTYTI